MSEHELEQWLDTEESKEVGQKSSDDAESTGHHSGKLIIEILGKQQSEYSADDFAQMKRVHSYVARHSAQKPGGDIEHTHWRYSLMNWGHDPLKKQ